MDLQIEVKGLVDLDAQLARLGNELAGKALFGALASGALIVKKEAISLVPQSPKPYKRFKKGAAPKLKMGGDLRKAIRVKRIKGLEHATVAVIVRDRAFYWRFLEHGTAKMPAKPFLRPAFDRTHPQAVDKFGGILQRRIDKIIAKQAQEADSENNDNAE